MVQSAATDEVFRALSNHTRRKVLERLSVGPATVSELAEPFDVPLLSFVQHLAWLEGSRLVRSKRHTRVRTHGISSKRFQVVDDWLAARRQLWGARPDRFDRYVNQPKDKGVTIMSGQLILDQKLASAIQRFIDAPTRLAWEALTKPETSFRSRSSWRWTPSEPALAASSRRCTGMK